MSDLTFRPFAMLPAEELRRERRYWKDMAGDKATPALTKMVAIRHYRRCVENERARSGDAA